MVGWPPASEPGRHEIRELTDEQARAVLARWADVEPELLSGEAGEILKECGNLPLALAMIGAALRGRPHRWANVLRKLREAELEKIQRDFPDYPYPSVLQSIEVSVHALEPKVQAQYLDLAVFPDGTPIPPPTLERLWGLDSFDAGRRKDQPMSPIGLAEQLTLFYSYAHEDEALRDGLAKHLASLRREGLVSEWHDRKIGAGEEWADAIDDNLEKASIVLLLVSPDFMASDYCNEVEVTRAMQHHEMGVTRVIPVILRPTDWEAAPFGKLQAMPTGTRPVVEWDDRDAAFVNVADGVRDVCRELIESPGNSANPYTIAKVGDWVEFESKVLVKETGQQIVSRFRNELIAKDDRKAVVEMTIESADGTEVKTIDVNLEQPLEDSMGQMVRQVTEPIPPNAVIEMRETGAGKDKLFIGENVYYATWRGKEVSISVGADKMVVTGKTWLSSEIPLDGIVKLEQHMPESSTTTFVVGYGREGSGTKSVATPLSQVSPKESFATKVGQPPPEQPIGLLQILPGSWQVQIGVPMMGGLTAMFHFDPGGSFSGQINNPMTGIADVQGQWAAVADQLEMQGQQSAGFIPVPYLAILQFTVLQSDRLQGVSNAGEQVSMVKVQ